MMFLKQLLKNIIELRINSVEQVFIKIILDKINVLINLVYLPLTLSLKILLENVEALQESISVLIDNDFRK